MSTGEDRMRDVKEGVVRHSEKGYEEIEQG